MKKILIIFVLLLLAGCGKTTINNEKILGGAGDLVFGYGIRGANTYTGGANTFYTSALTYTPASDGTLVSISVHAGSSAVGRQWKAAIYNGNTLVDYTATSTLPGDYFVGWATSTVMLGATVTAGTQYYITQEIESTTGHVFYYDTEADYSKYYTAANFASNPPSTISWSTSGTYKNQYSIYVTYTPSGSPAADSCNYSGSGNWNVLQTDNCYATSTVYVNGDFNLIGNAGGTGSFGCAPGVKVSATAFNFGTGRTNLDIDCFAHH